MPIYFEDVCDLLESLETLETRQPPLLFADKSDRLQCTTEAWFRKRRPAIDRLDKGHATALLSTLLPERRTDRVYGLQTTSLARLLCRGLNLGDADIKTLQAYKQPGRGDLGHCLGRTIEQIGPPALPKVDLEELDELLNWLGSQCRFSTPALIATAPALAGTRDVRIGHVIKRLNARDAKWFVRLVLKDFAPVSLNEQLILKSMHFLLPDLLRLQQDIPAALLSLRTTFAAYPSAPDPASERLLAVNASSALVPQVGIKISRPAFVKARSIRHCLKMAGQRRWVVERKYDGEYCEVHIDLSISSEPERCIKIFSKNAKDATQDRHGILSTLVSCLRLGRPDCMIKRQAVLVGELVVWSDATNNVLPFEEIRKHVRRSGSFLGTRQDSPPEHNEHLCVVFYDILLLDNSLLLKEFVEKRREVLKSVYSKLPGRAKSTEWKVIDFERGEISKRRLVEHFAASNAMACEGLVLKPCGVPYFNLACGDDTKYNGYIKLKKDYIAGLGDEADFAVIGGSYDAQDAAALRTPGPRWTRFHIAAMTNKELALRYQHRPMYKILATIIAVMCIPTPVLETANRLGILLATHRGHEDDDTTFDIEPGSHITIDTIFRTPLVFEILGSGFVKPSDGNFFMLRHPRVKKLHQDRSWKDCIGFSELQTLARDARTTGVESESQEVRHQLARLERSMKRKFERMSKTPSPVKPTSAAQLSPPRSSGPVRRALGELSANAASDHGLTTTASHECPTHKGTQSPRKRRRLQTNSVQHYQSTRTEPLPRNPAEPRSSTLRPTISRRLVSFDSLTIARRACIAADCILSRAVIYLAPCVASTPYVVSDLVECHATTRTADWQHWLRQSGKSEAGLVQESQAYPGLQRIVVSEGRRKEALRGLVHEMLNERDLRGSSIEVWDWRILEMLQEHATSLDETDGLLLGRLIWNVQHERMDYEVTDFGT